MNMQEMLDYDEKYRIAMDNLLSKQDKEGITIEDLVNKVLENEKNLLDNERIKEYNIFIE